MACNSYYIVCPQVIVQCIIMWKVTRIYLTCGGQLTWKHAVTYDSFLQLLPYCIYCHQIYAISGLCLHCLWDPLAVYLPPDKALFFSKKELKHWGYVYVAIQKFRTVQEFKHWSYNTNTIIQNSKPYFVFFNKKIKGSRAIFQRFQNYNIIEF